MPAASSQAETSCADSTPGHTHPLLPELRLDDLKSLALRRSSLGAIHEVVDFSTLEDDAEDACRPTRLGYPFAWLHALPDALYLSLILLVKSLQRLTDRIHDGLAVGGAQRSRREIEGLPGF